MKLPWRKMELNKALPKVKRRVSAPVEEKRPKHDPALGLWTKPRCHCWGCFCRRRK